MDIPDEFGLISANEYARTGAPGTMSDVIEFLIRTLDGPDWPAVHRDRLSHVLTPGGWDCVSVSGWGDYRLRCGDTEISFSAEPVGWQVSFEGPMPEDVATQLVVVVASQIEQEINQSIDWIQIDS
jgi:hypothetical protein